MRRVKSHHVKQERPETSTSVSDAQHDLTYYIHDRVELMHQVFSVLKPKELKSMAPSCVQHISLSDLQELCMEELLGISSKRLCAILDGAEPPSDTETSSTSSPEKLETISLDSISSDEEILSESSSKKKKKHKHHHCKSKSKSKHKRSSSSEASDVNEDRSKASRAGLTVLELLELQARARAIRAQLQQVQAADPADATASQTVEQVSDDEVEIKEEPAEVVEISSEDEKPKIEDLQKAQTSKNTTVDSNNVAQTVTKRIKDLIITVPVTKTFRKIKLNRNKPPATLTADANQSKSTEPDNETIDKERLDDDGNSDKRVSRNIDTVKEKSNPNSVPTDISKAAREKQKKKPKKKEKGKVKNKEGSDNDEITLQLSDTEKMDLLEDLDRKNYEVVSSSSTEDSESSSDSSDGDEKRTESESVHGSSKVTQGITEMKINPEADPPASDNVDSVEFSDGNKNTKENLEKCENNVEENKEENAVEKSRENDSELEVVEIPNVEQMIVQNNCNLEFKLNLEQKPNDEKGNDQEPMAEESLEINCNVVSNNEDKLIVEGNCEKQVEKCDNKDKSEGEISDRESSEVEATEVKPEVVCISDEDVDNKKAHKKKKNKKKEKKAKKEKKSKKCQDFRNVSDQNFYTESTSKESTDKLGDGNAAGAEQGACVDDDVYEILELSDESSCNGEDGHSVLSKEPTAEEIAALSAKIDEIEREDVITEEEIREHEKAEAEKLVEDAENITWKDRYLDSRKVKSVLTTANILNAMRKKNKELKRKLEESKKESVVIVPQVVEEAETNLEEGSIEQYNTLEASIKYVDPAAAVRGEGNEKTKVNEGKVTNEMKKDAKQLLKMYKKLLNYNDMNRKRDPNKKKKKKHKKNKEDKSKTELPAEAKSNS